MEGPYGIPNGEVPNHGFQIIKYSPYQTCTKQSLPWFDLRVFYVRISNFQVDGSTLEALSVNHIPLNPDTLLEVNGCRAKNCSDGVSSVLRRDRVDKKSEEATFVSTDSIRLTGSVKFEVFDQDDLILSGVLEMSNSNGFTKESKNSVKRWSMNCESEIGAASLFTMGDPPTIEVYVAGSFAGSPIILTKTLQITSRKKNNRTRMLYAIPENETTECLKDEPFGPGSQVTEYSTKTEYEEDYGDQMYWGRNEYMEGEDGELTWFNAGVRVGVGIGLGICVGVGVGVGLLVRTYHTASRNFRRRLV